MGINFDDFWIVGSVRIRASAPDPYAGLRGRAYIAARKLDQRPLEKIESQAAADAKAESAKNLIKAINQRPALAGRGVTRFVHLTGSKEFLTDSCDRRFFVIEQPQLPRKLRRAK